MEQIIKQISEYLPQALFLGAGAVSAYALALGGLSHLSGVFSEKITSQEQLEKVVREEADKLGVDIEEAVLREDGSGCARSSEDGFRIAIDKESANRSVVRHEVYHAFKKHPKKPGQRTSFAKYLFVQEPQAVAYQVLGLRL